MKKLFIKPYSTVLTLLFLRDKEEKEIFLVGKHLHQGWLEEMRLMQLNSTLHWQGVEVQLEGPLEVAGRTQLSTAAHTTVAARVRCC